jgi:DNA-binding NarL/FixJ family response regulator
MALAQAAAGRLDDARNTLDEVLGLLPPEPTPMRVRLIAAAGTLDQMLGRITETRRRLLAAVETTPPELAAPLELALAWTAYSDVDLGRMADWAERALEHADEADTTLRAGAEALAGHAAVLQGEPERGHALVESAIERLGRVDDAELTARVDDAFLVSAGALLAERPQAGLPVATRAIEVARRTRQDRVLPMVASVRSMLYEHHLQALQDAEASTESARLFGHDGQLVQALITQANIHWIRGERAEAARFRTECIEVASRLEPTTITSTALCNAASQLVDEDPERCIRDMTAAGGSLLERADRSWSTWLLRVLVRAALALGRTADAERWTEAIVERAEATTSPGALARAASAKADLLLASGDAAEAARIAGQGAADADAAGMRLDAVAAGLTAGRALGAAGEREAAVALLQRVAAEATRGNAGLFVEEASRELRRLGTRVSTSTRRAAAPAGENALTERERQIADLVSEGRSNKQVAAALFLSEKTIEHNLSRIYAKLGVRSRVELAGRLAR